MASIVTPGADARWIPASRKRRVLAIYVDLVILGIPWALASALLRRLLPGIGVPGPVAAVFAFVVAEALLIRLARYTPGYALLGMRFATLSPSGRPPCWWIGRSSGARAG